MQVFLLFMQVFFHASISTSCKHMVPFFINTEINLILFRIFCLLLCIWVELRRNIFRSIWNETKPCGNLILELKRRYISEKENFWQSVNFTAVFAKNTKKKRLNFPKFAHNFPVDTGHKLNVHKTFRTRPGRLLNILCAFNLRPVSTRFPSEKVNFRLIYLTYISIHNFWRTLLNS